MYYLDMYIYIYMYVCIHVCTYMHYIICGCQMEYLFSNNPDVMEDVWYEVPGYMIIIQPQSGTPK